MQNKLKDYMVGSKNVVKDEFIISREKTTNSELVFVQHPTMNEPLYIFWHTYKKCGKKPKHTGGKKPYVMLMIEELIRLMENGVPAECAGYLLYLVPYIEWGTGRLLYGRDKRIMKIKDITKVLGKGERTVFRILGNLKKHGLLSHKDGSYFISRSIIKRGALK